MANIKFTFFSEKRLIALATIAVADESSVPLQTSSPSTKLLLLEYFSIDLETSIKGTNVCTFGRAKRDRKF